MTVTVVDALGVPVRVGPALTDPLRHLPRSDRASMFDLDKVGINAGVRELTRLAVEHTSLLTIHAGVVATEWGVTVFPAVSGAGKSTLVAACTAAGFRYVCDEVLALDRTSGEVVDFPRPIALSASSRVLLGLDDSDVDERFVDPTALGSLAGRQPGRVREVVVPRRVVGRAEPPSLRPLDAPAVLAALLPRCFNHYRSPSDTWRVLTKLIGEVRGFEAVYTDARDLASLLRRTLDRDAA